MDAESEPCPLCGTPLADHVPGPPDPPGPGAGCLIKTGESYATVLWLRNERPRMDITEPRIVAAGSPSIVALRDAVLHAAEFYGDRKLRETVEGAIRSARKNSVGTVPQQEAQEPSLTEIVKWLRDRAPTCVTEEATYFHNKLAEVIERELGEPTSV